MLLKLKLFMLFIAIFALFSILVPENAFAVSKVLVEGWGENIFCNLQLIIRGNVGTLLGFGLAIGGFILFILGNTSSGLLFILFGISISALPGMYLSVLEGLEASFKDIDNNKEIVGATQRAIVKKDACDAPSKNTPDEKPDEIQPESELKCITSDGTTTNKQLSDMNSECSSIGIP